MERERANLGHGGVHEDHHGGPFRSKKKEKGYKTVGLNGSSDEEQDHTGLIQPSSEQSAPKSSSKSRPFRLKKHKSFKERKTGSEEALERSKVKHHSHTNTNPFGDHHSQSHSSGKVKVNTALLPAGGSAVSDTHIFGISLSRAIEIDRSADGSDVPAFFRVCVNYIQDHGLDSLGIYRTAGVQSKINELKEHFNRGDRVRLNDYDPPTVADVIKAFIRQLPQRLLSDQLTIEIDQCADLPDLGKRVDTAVKVLHKLPSPERAVLGLVLVHMTHVIEHQEMNKMSLKNVALVLEPTLSIRSSKALNFLLTHAIDLFPDTKIHRSVGNAASNTGNEQSLSLLREELSRKEATLSHLHREIKEGKASKKKEEKIWEIQRTVTELKRKIRTLEKITNVIIGSETHRRPSDSIGSSSSKATSMLVPQQMTSPVMSSGPAEDASVTQRTVHLELIETICCYQLFAANNTNLRERIFKENHQLNTLLDQLKDLPPTVAVAESDLDEGQMVEELRHVMDQYRSSKKLRDELNDAILSETCELVRISAEIHSRKLRSQMSS